MHSAPTLPAVAPPTDGAGELTRGSVFGRYVILDVLGEGGMGVVYAAHDGALDRTVALKVVRGREARAQAWLAREAMAMARVQHPAIVAVHDVGAVGARVFISMELVKGTTLRDWLGAERTWREIVRAFVAVGRGLEAAHVAGVIHRDFKPENVLVDETGRVRVTDFGLAEIVSGEGVERNFSSSAGTPWFKAPEQYRKEPIDARTDQYSFCVALWHAVYGEHPFVTDDGELAAAVMRGALRPPTSRAPRWLADILARGLATRPEARYPAMTGLLVALERRVSPSRRWVFVPVGAALAIAAGSLAFAATRDRGGPICAIEDEHMLAAWAPERRDQVERTLASLAPTARARLLGTLDGYVRLWQEHRLDACRATLERGEQSGDLLDLRMSCFERRREELEALVGVLASGDPAVAARAQQAVENLAPVAACGDTAALREAVPPPDHPLLRARVDDVRRRLASVRANLETGRYALGFAAVEPLAVEANALGHAPLVAEAERLRGALAWRTERMDLAEQALYRAVGMAEAGRAGPEAARAWLDLLWFVTQERKRGDEARRLGVIARGALERYRQDPALAAALAERLGLLALDAGDLEAARRDLERALELRRGHFGDDHRATGSSLQHLAVLHTARGDHAAAVEHHRRAVATVERALGTDHPDVWLARNGLAVGLFESGRLDEALPILERGLAHLESIPTSDAVDRSMHHNNIAVILGRHGRHAEAIAHQTQALALLERVKGSGAPDVAIQRAEVARTLREAGRHGEAIAAYERALAAVEAAFPRDSVDVADTLDGLALSLVEAGRGREAVAHLDRALQIYKARGRGEAVERVTELRARAMRPRQ